MQRTIATMQQGISNMRSLTVTRLIFAFALCSAAAGHGTDSCADPARRRDRELWQARECPQAQPGRCKEGRSEREGCVQSVGAVAMEVGWLVRGETGGTTLRSDCDYSLLALPESCR